MRFRFHPSRLKNFVCALAAAPLLGIAAEDAGHQKRGGPNPSAHEFDASAAERFAKLALACVHKEYPNKISHVLNSDADVAPPRNLTPRFAAVTIGIPQCTGTGCWCDCCARSRMHLSQNRHVML